MQTCFLNCLNEKITCFLPVNLRCIDLVLTNKKNLFKKIIILEVHLLDDHGFVDTAFRGHVKKENAKTIT